MPNNSNDNKNKEEFEKNELKYKVLDNTENFGILKDLEGTDIKEYLQKASDIIKSDENSKSNSEKEKIKDINELIQRYKKQNRKNKIYNNVELEADKEVLDSNIKANSSQPSEAKKAAVYAMSLLMRREYSKLEIINKLKTKYQEDTINRVITYLEQNNYLSQERFIEMIVRSYSSRGYGVIRIQQELSKRGVSGNTILEVIKDLNIDMKSNCKNMAEKKLKIMSKSLLTELNLDKDSLEYKKIHAKNKQKILRFLSARGFTSEECFYAVNSVCSNYGDFDDYL